MASSSGAPNDPWAWLGLLKWSLSYADGTSDSKATPMSPEDRAFLEKVMKEGIIDENQRMKEILKQVTEFMEKWKTAAAGEGVNNEEVLQAEAEETEVLLQELRDIVEQIDYARAFAAMKGLSFLLGCIQERSVMPRSTRLMCLGILATMSQNNPAVQKELLEAGSIQILSDLYFAEHNEGSDPEGTMRARIIQAVSANVRSNELAEAVFCELDQSATLLGMGIGMERGDTTLDPLTTLRQKSLFFLRALVTSDTSTRERVRRFGPLLSWTVDQVLNANEESAALRELSLELVEHVLGQKLSVNAIILPVERKNSLTATCVKTIAKLRKLTGEEKEYAAAELELWERLLQRLAEDVPDSEDGETSGTQGSSAGTQGPSSTSDDTASSAPLMLGAPPDYRSTPQ